MKELSKWFPALDQMPDSLKAFCSIAGATVVVCAVVLFVVLRGRKANRAGPKSE